MLTPTQTFNFKVLIALEREKLLIHPFKSANYEYSLSGYKNGTS